MSDAQAQNVIVGAVVKSQMTIDTKRFGMRIEGHRGAGYLEPENSIKAFKRAIELGLESVEFDVWLTSDDVPIVLHGMPGGLVEFQGGVQDAISQIHSKDLHKYILHNGETIPTLAEVFDTCKDKVCLNIEVKEVRPEVMGKILDLAQERDMFDQICFSSFNHYHRETLTRETIKRRLAKDVSFGFLMRVVDPKMPNYERDTKPGDSINIDMRYLERSREECVAHIMKAKEKKMKVIFWFPMEYTHEDSFYDDLVRLGVDTIITNKPIVVTDYFLKKEIGA